MGAGQRAGCRAGGASRQAKGERGAGRREECGPGRAGAER